MQIQNYGSPFPSPPCGMVGSHISPIEVLRAWGWEAETELTVKADTHHRLIIERPTPHDPQQQKLRFTLGVSAPNAMLRGAVISVCLSDLLGYQVSLMPN